MTRINVLPASCLSGKHLVAAWKEYPRMITYVEKLNASAREIIIPERYTFNDGHMRFFVDKMMYIWHQIVDVYHEMRDRGYRPDESLLLIYRQRIWALPERYKGYWKPSPKDQYLNMARLVERTWEVCIVEGRSVYSVK